MKLERAKNTKRNMVFGFINKIICMLFPFVIRTIIIRIIGKEYLGLDSLFTSILQVLNLAEMGFSSAVVYNMYKPIAEENDDLLCQILKFYKKVYFAIGMVILFAGIAILPFLTRFINGEYPQNVNIYVLYTTSVRTLPEDKWIIAENAHAAIVTKDEYYQAQKAIRNVTPIQYKVGDDFALKGKICCGNCNRQLRHERQYGEMVFYCGYKRSAGKFSKCYGGYYREYSVNAKVARAIKTVFYALDVVNQGMQEKQSVTVRCMDIEDLEKQAEAIRVEQIKLYESYVDGVLRRDAYIEKKKALSEKLAVLQDSIRTEKEEQECADELDEEIRALTKQASEKTYIGGLTKECVDAFVSMVYLYDDQTMKIEFNCEDVIRRALEKYGA